MKRTKKILYLLGVLLTTLNFAQANASEKLTDGAVVFKKEFKSSA
jgi:hypothetical protein